jgi:hypothetical protein
MRKIIFVCLLILVALFSTATAQYEQPQWEYLVIYENGNVNLNELGRKSWELVGLTFNEGNPVRLFFKRAYIPERTRLEAEQAKNAESPKVKVDFVELDQAEFVARENETANKIKNRFEQAVKNSGIKVEIRQISYDSRSKQIRAFVVVDGSSVLLKDGNKYRLSEAKKYNRQIASEIFNRIGLKPTLATADSYNENGSYFPQPGNVLISLATIISNGESKRFVAEGHINGNWDIPE